MQDSTILALIALAAVLALGLIASVRRRKRLRSNEVGDLPTFLYLASHTQDAKSPASETARRTNGSTMPRGDVAGGSRNDGGATSSRLLPGSQGAAKPEILGWAPVADETVQLLPGRLEPIPEGAGQEIRFVRRPGVTRFTFGRSRGPAFEHVQLRVASASRMHAYMEFERGRWRIGSLSETNSVRVNGAPVEAGSAQTLDDGDCIEMGAAAFTFRQPALRVHSPVLSRGAMQSGQHVRPGPQVQPEPNEAGG